MAIRSKASARQMEGSNPNTVEVVIQESTGNGHASTVGDQEYAVEVAVVGTSPLLMHRYDTVSVKRKGSAAKNSAEKKSDDLESYVYRDPSNPKQIGIPGRNFLSCLREAARSIPDPRSPRKSARDLVATGLRVEPFIASLGKTSWDYIDEQRVVIQRSAVSRSRPAFKEGWQVTFRVLVLAPEYINEDWLHELIQRAGRFQGLLDARNIGYGLFRVSAIKRIRLTSEGPVWYGEVWHGRARSGSAWHARVEQGGTRCCKVRSGSAWQGPVSNGKAGQCSARSVSARPDTVQRGWVRRGTARSGTAR